MSHSAITTPMMPEKTSDTMEMMACSFTFSCLNRMVRGTMEVLASRKPRNA